jgi:hypothetical protein
MLSELEARGGMAVRILAQPAARLELSATG